MSKEVHLNPIDEKDLEDKRNEIAENCFLELDIALKGYKIAFGEDATQDEISLLHSTFAYLLSNHENEHKLANVDIDKFKIPDSPFKNEEGIFVDELYSLQPKDLIHFITNMIINSKNGFVELSKSGYFQSLNTGLMIENHALLFQLGTTYDRCILLMNNKYSKLILNIN